MGLRTLLGLKKRPPTAVVAAILPARPQLVQGEGVPSAWERRQNLIYMQHVAAIVRFVAKDAKSIVDIGTAGYPYLEWFDWIPRKVSIDLKRPYRSPRVEGIKSDFLSLPITEKFDCALCLQTMEHVPDVERFARKLTEIASRVIVSVPYLWAAGTVKGHIHDPVDEEKVDRWFGRKPDFQLISTEMNRTQRLIAYFECRQNMR